MFVLANCNAAFYVAFGLKYDDLFRKQKSVFPLNNMMTICEVNRIVQTNERYTIRHQKILPNNEPVLWRCTIIFSISLQIYFYDPCHSC